MNTKRLAGGTTRLDFIFAIEKESGIIEVNLLIETKAGDIRMSEERAIKAQERLFANIDSVRWRKVVKASELGQIIRKL